MNSAVNKRKWQADLQAARRLPYYHDFTLHDDNITTICTLNYDTFVLARVPFKVFLRCVWWKEHFDPSYNNAHLPEYIWKYIRTFLVDSQPKRCKLTIKPSRMYPFERLHIVVTDFDAQDAKLMRLLDDVTSRRSNNPNPNPVYMLPTVAFDGTEVRSHLIGLPDILKKLYEDYHTDPQTHPFFTFGRYCNVITTLKLTRKCGREEAIEFYCQGCVYSSNNSKYKTVMKALRNRGLPVDVTDNALGSSAAVVSIVSHRGEVCTTAVDFQSCGGKYVVTEL